MVGCFVVWSWPFSFVGVVFLGLLGGREFGVEGVWLAPLVGERDAVLGFPVVFVFVGCEREVVVEGAKVTGC